MTVERMRAAILKVYPNITWKEKVFRMRDNQVIAIYYNFLERGKFMEKPKKVEYKEETPAAVETNLWELNGDDNRFSGDQLSLF